MDTCEHSPDGYHDGGACTHCLRAAKEEGERLRDALTDMLSGWRYIREVHGDLYGVGWDRAQTKAEAALRGEVHASECINPSGSTGDGRTNWDRPKLRGEVSDAPPPAPDAPKAP